MSLPRNAIPGKMSVNEIAAHVIELSFQIHRKWGPGMLESVYEALLAHHLRKDGFKVEQQKGIAFVEDGIKIDVGYRADLLVEDKLIVEIKSVEIVPTVVPKIVLTYLRGTRLTLGLLINFGEAYLKDGIKRIVNGFKE